MTTAKAITEVRKVNVRGVSVRNSRRVIRLMSKIPTMYSWNQAMVAE
jgi:hypothetical protein